MVQKTIRGKNHEKMQILNILCVNNSTFTENAIKRTPCGQKQEEYG